MRNVSNLFSDPVLAILLSQLLLIWSLITSQFEWSKSKHAKGFTLSVAIPLAVFQIYVGLCLVSSDASRQSQIDGSLKDIASKAISLVGTETKIDRQMIEVRGRIAKVSDDLNQLDGSVRGLNAAIGVQKDQLGDANSGISDLSTKADEEIAIQRDRERAEEDRAKKEHEREECITRYREMDMDMKESTILFFCDH